MNGGSPATLVVNNTANYSFNGYLRNTRGGGSGTLGLTKDGAGILTLLGSNITYTEDTLVQGGTLSIGNGVTGGSINSDVTIANGGTLRLNTPASDSVNNNRSISVQAGGALDLRENEDIAGLAGAGTVTNTSAGSYVLQVGRANASSTFSGAIEDGPVVP